MITVFLTACESENNVVSSSNTDEEATDTEMYSDKVSEISVNPSTDKYRNVYQILLLMYMLVLIQLA